MDHSENNEHALNTRLLRYRSAPDSQDPQALAEDLLGARRFGDARGVVVSAQPAEYDDPRLLLVEGQAWLCEGQVESALERFVAVVALEPKRADGFLWLGKALLLRDDPMRAVHALEQALELDAELDEAKTALLGAEAALTRVQELKSSPESDASSEAIGPSEPECAEDGHSATLTQSFDDDQDDVAGTAPGIGALGTTPGLGPMDGAGEELASTYESFESSDASTSSAGDLDAITIEVAQSSAGEIDAPTMQTTSGSMHHDEADWSDVAGVPAAGVAEDTDEVTCRLDERVRESNSPEGVFRAQGEEHEAAWSPDVQWDGPVVGAFSGTEKVHVDSVEKASENVQGQRDSGFGLSFWEDAGMSDVQTPVVACGEAFVEAKPGTPLSLRPVDVAVVPQGQTGGRRVAGVVTAGVLLLCGGAGYMATRASMEEQGLSNLQTQALAVLDDVRGLGEGRLAEMETWALGVTGFEAAATDVGATDVGVADVQAIAVEATDARSASARVARPNTESTQRAQETLEHVAAPEASAPPRLEPTATVEAVSQAAIAKPVPEEVSEAKVEVKVPDVEQPAVVEKAMTFESVEALLSSGDLKAARRAFARLPKPERRAAPGRMLLAEIELNAGRPWRALDVLEALRSQADRSVDLLTLLGRTLYAADQVNRAAGAYDLALAVAPKHFEALVGRGEIHLRAERTAAAIVVLERAQRLAKRSRKRGIAAAKLPALLGHAYLQREQAGDRELAYNVLHAAVVGGDVIVDTHFWLGESLAGRRTPEASAAYSHYLELSPKGRYAERARRALGPLF